MITKNAKKLLFTVTDVLKDAGLPFMLYGGTALGAVRDRKFIPVDKDVDLAALREDFVGCANEIAEKLRAAGITVEVIDHRHRHPWDGTPYAIKFYGFGEHGDLATFEKRGNKRVIPSHAGSFWLEHEARFLEQTKEIRFYRRKFLIPANTNGFFAEKYGLDWRTPHTKFDNISKNRVGEL